MASDPEENVERSVSATRKWRILACFLALGAPILLALVTLSAKWLHVNMSYSLGGYRQYQWLALANALLATISTASAVLIFPGTTPRERLIGIIAGAISGFMIYTFLIGPV